MNVVSLRIRRLAVHVIIMVIAGFFFLHAPSASSQSLPVVRQGDRGPAVVLAQDLLHRLGFLSGEPDGMFGPATARAVRAFQQRSGLTVDGVVGPSTWARLREQTAVRTERHVVRPGQTLWRIARRYGVTVTDLAAANGLRDPDRIRAGTELVIPLTTAAGGSGRRPVELALWREVSQFFSPGKTARVIDVETGKSFNIRRYRGTYHADVEPLTARDTQIMRDVYGGRWSWERRAIILEVDGRRFAASMNGVPHGRSAISNNQFPGHFCIHLLGSSTHGTRRVDFQHQWKILQAAGYEKPPRWVNGLGPSAH